MFGTSIHRHRWVGATVPIGLGAGLVAATGWHALQSGTTSVDRGLDVVIAGVFLLTLVGGGLWLATRDRSRHAWRVAAWTAGALAVTALIVPLVLYRGGDTGPELLSTLAFAQFGGLGASAGFVTGLYDRRRLTQREQLRSTATRLEALIEASPVPIVSIDADHRVEHWNEAAAETFGWSAGEVIDEPYPLVPPDCESEFSEHTARLREGEVLRTVETRRQRKDGTAVDVSLSVAPLFDGGDYAGGMAVMVDISDRKRREQRLEVMNRVLRHNLRNAVTVIEGCSTYVREHLDDDGLCDHIETVERTAADLSAVSEKARHIEQVLDRTGRSRAVEVDELLSELRREFERRYPAADVTIDERTDEGASVDRTLEFALEEAIENAIEHNDRGAPTVRLAARDDDGSVRVSVTDDGPGLPEQDRAALDRGEEQPLAHGSGIGLWFIKWIVGTLGGDLSIEDADPRGTALAIRLPRDPVVTAGDGDPRESEPRATGR